MSLKNIQNQVLSLFLQGPIVLFKWKNLTSWPMEYVSSNVDTLIGYTYNELTSGHIAYGDIIHPDDIERVKSELLEFKYHSSSAYFQHQPYRLCRKDKQYIWVADHTMIIRQATKITHFVGYVMDITVRQLHCECLLVNTHNSMLELSQAIKIVAEGKKQRLEIDREVKNIRDGAAN